MTVAVIVPDLVREVLADSDVDCESDAVCVPDNVGVAVDDDD